MELSTVAIRSFDSQATYPQSISNGTGPNRSRVLSEDLATFWNEQITGIESLEERVRIHCIHTKFAFEVDQALLKHQRMPTTADEYQSSIRLTNTYLPGTPQFLKAASSPLVTLHFHERDASHACVSVLQIEKNSTLKLQKNSLDLTKPRRLLSADTPALALFDSLASLVQQAIKDMEKVTLEKPAQIVVSLGFPVEAKSSKEAILLYWTRGFATGRKTLDSAEGLSVDALLECAFGRAKIPAKVSMVMNDAVSGSEDCFKVAQAATFLAASWEKPADLPQCGVAIVIGHGVNACFYHPDATSVYNFSTSLINCDIGNFDKDLPINDVDVEVDFAEEANVGKQSFEKMIGVAYIEELCRRTVVKVWQSEAPRFAWLHHSLHWMACVAIIQDTTETLKDTETILFTMWDWTTTFEERKAVQQLFQAVFDRAAVLSAIAVVTLASHTGLLQPAMGGITVAVTGKLYECSKYFRDSLQKHIKDILKPEHVPYIHLLAISDGVAKGAGLTAYLTPAAS